MIKSVCVGKGAGSSVKGNTFTSVMARKVPCITSNTIPADEAMKYCLAWTGPDDWGQFRMLARYFADAAALIPNLVEDVINRPLGILGTVRCRHWHDRGNVLLIGDAAHAIVPFHGQGMNLAFEDCALLDRLVTSIGSDWQRVFATFENMQLLNANAIADMALENYIEMRDTVRDVKFALRKALAFELERRLPEYFIPRYAMVMFHPDIPYLVAQERGEVQALLLEEFTRDADSLDAVDIDRAAAAVTERLAPITTVTDSEP